ncbi:Zinc finger and BTB domain-containing protein 44 [Colletotrichum orbiculare MAFF 240422]|uniref:Zinc finger and BTB domain-containing protein 44 n=1 Tax=Colletotrichum orbiculare (strain 104-T / ATCC 96160 / CBS 514.97 / LARS 414 / MAFF 240422) TaxID=1213857 RepID=A0A484FSS8_COLOR|nr:Zinc finger and BTB domain-containing protein 44 [Colletotrichum orbiculare MAFF 240422]
MAMETTSFGARRTATQALPPFQLPSTNQDIPRVTGEGLSPLSGVNTTSSQGSYYPGNSHGSWPTPGSYQLSSSTPQPIGQQSHYNSRASTYEQQSPLAYSRTSQSPATGGEGLPAPSYAQGHQPFQTSYPHPAAGAAPASLPSHGASAPQSAILGSQPPISTQPPTPGGMPSAVDSYAQSRPPATPGYYAASAPHQSGFHNYAHHTSPTAPSPTTSVGSSRGLSSLQHPPGLSYRYNPYGGVPSMAGSIMSNLNAPNHQMSLVQGMAVPYGAHIAPSMYGHSHGGPPNPQAERPFKCDQCPQSFNRNHDLKRHKRIHLAVKPFPCNWCEKSFSRKDALKRHKLVKGCGTNKDEGNDSNQRSPDHSDDGTPPLKREG